MSDLTSFDNFVNSAMGGRFQKMIYINIMKETTATKSQYLFENLNTAEMSTLVTHLNTNPNVLNFVKKFKKGMKFMVRFHNSYTEIRLENGSSSQFFKESIKWFQDKYVVNKFDNNTSNSNRFNNTLKLFNNMSEISFTNNYIEFVLDKRMSGSKETQLDLFRSTMRLFNAVEKAFGFNKQKIFREYILWIRGLKRHKYILNSIEVNADGSFIVTAKQYSTAN